MPKTPAIKQCTNVTLIVKSPIKLQMYNITAPMMLFFSNHSGNFTNFINPQIIAIPISGAINISSPIYKNNSFQIGTRFSIAFAIVTLSVPAKSAPTDIPCANFVTFTFAGFKSFAIKCAVAVPSTFGSNAIITS